jgi:coenzyme F420 hydrogenase subunit beta
MIDKIVKNELCNSCGICYSVCPNEAIRFEKTAKSYHFRVDSAKCSHCGRCLNICPGVKVEFKKLNRFVFGQTASNNLLGNFKKCYLGYSKNKKIRFLASSGGIVTSLLIYLLEKKIVDGVLVTGMSKINPLEPEIFIAYNKKGILKAVGSKYLPVPLNIGLKEVLKTKKKKFAVVGLPCHLQGIRKVQIENRELRKKIFLCLGLFCGGTVSFRGTEFLLKLQHLNPSEVKEIKFRGEGWPGKITIKTRNKTLFLSFTRFFNLFNYGLFVPPRCFSCIDFSNELADISFGDAWVPGIMEKDKVGTNIVISRTKKGEEILRQTKNFISLKEIDEKKIIKAFWWRFYSKKKLHGFISRLGRKFGYYTPDYDGEFENKTSFDAIPLAIFFLNSVVTDKFPSLLLKMPQLFWYLFLKFYQLIYSVFWRLKRSG